jgi:hypothetical protein
MRKRGREEEELHLEEEEAFKEAPEEETGKKEEEVPSVALEPLNVPEEEEETKETGEEQEERETAGGGEGSPDDSGTKKPVPMFDKTPGGLSTETPEETSVRYNIDLEVTKEGLEDLDENCREKVRQIPAGTHLHPDYTNELLRKGGNQASDSAQVVRDVTVGHSFADEVEEENAVPPEKEVQQENEVPQEDKQEVQQENEAQQKEEVAQSDKF